MDLSYNSDFDSRFGRPGEPAPKLDNCNIEEAESSLRESAFLNYEHISQYKVYCLPMIIMVNKSSTQRYQGPKDVHSLVEFYHIATDDVSDHTIYKRGGRDMGIYHMCDGSIEPHFTSKSVSYHSPPMWVEPMKFENYNYVPSQV